METPSTRPLAAGAALVDRSGAIAAADAGFRALLGLPEADPGTALRARADAEPALRTFLAGEGPAAISVAGGEGGALELERIPAGDAVLVVARSESLGDALEHAMRSVALGRIASGFVHDAKSPLNTMSLQIALLGEKLSGPDAAAAAAHLGSLREQVNRLNDMLRRFLDLADPSEPLGHTDVGVLLAEIGAFLGHEGRRRHVELAVDAPPGAVRSSCDAARVGRLLLGLFARALAETPEGGRLSARAEVSGATVTVGIEHAAGDPDPDLGYTSATAAAGARRLGGTLSEERRDGVARVTLALPRNDAR